MKINSLVILNVTLPEQLLSFWFLHFTPNMVNNLKKRNVISSGYDRYS